MLPFFYTENIEPQSSSIVLDEDNSRHVVSVLRMVAGEALHLTDGKGNLVTAIIADAHKKKCRVSVTGIETFASPAAKTAIGISLVKNLVRFEWFLEKATEVGITTIFPLLCSRTEKQHFRYHRMQQVMVSALLQSRQVWLPELHEPIKFSQVMGETGFQQKFIAHCLEEDKKNLGGGMVNPLASRLVLIGPEGDFTAEEIALSGQHEFIPVALGDTRLRTETAGLVAAVLLKMV